jgi:HEAT repeats
MFPFHLMKLERLAWLKPFLPPWAAGGGVMAASLLMAVCGQAGDGTDRLLLDIERCARLGTNAPEKLTRFVAEHVEEQAAQVSAFLVQKLAQPDADAESLKVYLGCLGLCRHTNGVPALIDFYGRTRSDDLKGRCYASLACIGSGPAVDFLLAELDRTTDRKRRFRMLNCVAQTRNEAVLPRTLEVLGADPHEEYWRPVFVFGKLGDVAVPFLIGKLEDTNQNVRANAAGVLGQWMMAPEALQPLRDQFWREQDAEIRGLIYCCVTGTHSRNVFTNFLGEIIARDKDTNMVNAAIRTLKQYPEDKAKFDSLRQKRRPSAETFRKHYALLYRSMGKEGDYEILDQASTLADEPALKKLRERILQRDSDEASDDYQKVSKIIWLNRLFAEPDSGMP